MADYTKSIEIVTKSEVMPTIRFYAGRDAAGNEILMVCVEIKTIDGAVIEHIQPLTELLSGPDTNSMLSLLASIHSNTLNAKGFSSK